MKTMKTVSTPAPMDTPAAKCRLTWVAAAMLVLAAGPSLAQRSFPEIEPREPRIPAIPGAPPIGGNPPPGAMPPPILPGPIAQPTLPPTTQPVVLPPAPQPGAGGALIPTPPPPPPVVVAPTPAPVPTPTPTAGPVMSTPLPARMVEPTAPPPVDSSPISSRVWVAAPAQAVQGAGPTPIKPGVMLSPGASDPTSIPGQGTGVSDMSPTAAPPLTGTSMSLVIPEKSSPVQGGDNLIRVTPASAQRASLGEVLPSSQDMSASMLSASSIAKPAKNNDHSASVPQPVCVPVSFRPDPSRAAVTLVDFSGDGLIVSAVPNVHINAVFARAGYRPLDIQQPVRWCVAQMAARELLGPSYTTADSHASLLVETTQGWQLMSKEQWATYQASLKPAPVTPFVSSAAAVVEAAAKRVGRIPVTRSVTRPPARAGFAPIPRLR